MARNLELNIGSDSSSARRSLEAAARSVDHLGDETRRLARQFDEASREAAELDRRLLATKAATAALASEFSRHGDVLTPHIKEKIKEQRDAIKEMQRLRADILGDTERDSNRAEQAFAKAFQELNKARKKFLDSNNRDTGIGGFFATAIKTSEKAGTEAAGTFAAALQGGLMNAFKALPPEAQAGIVSGIAAAISLGAPIIASAVSAAILLGVGGAGLAAGIALAVKNDRVKRAFSGLGEIVMANLQEAARPFQSELVESANIFGAAFRDSLPDIKGIFATLAQAVRPLAGGLAGLVRNMLPGLRRAAEAAVPIFRELARQAPEIGAALSDFFSSVAASGPGAVATFREILNLTKGLIVATGGWLEQLGYVAQGAAIVNSLMIPIGKQSSVLSGPLTDSLEDVGAAAERTGRSVRQLKIDFDALFGRQMDAREAAIAFEQAFDDLVEGFKRGSGALDINKQKGRDNIRLVDDLINAAREKLKADLAAGDGTQAAVNKANAAYQAEIERIREVLRHLHLTEAEINNLLGLAANIPQKITIDIGLIGAGAAAGQLQSIAGLLSKINGSGGKAGGLVGAVASAATKKRATGGPVVAGEAYIVGDGGKPEVFVPNTSGRILPDTSALARYATPSSASAQTATATLVYAGGGTPVGLEAIFLSWLMKKVRNGDLQLTSS